MSEDSTEDARRALIPQMPAELVARVEAGERFWTTEEMRAEFDVLGFLAPFVIVRRHADDVKGSLEFTDSPRFYFGWQQEP